MPDSPIPPHSAQVFPAEAMTVSAGVNLGDGFEAWEEACPGDTYRLAPDATPQGLLLSREAAPHGDGARQMPVAPGSPLGRPGDPVALVARFSLMSAEGDGIELLALEHRPTGATPALWLLPLSPMARGADYTLLRIEENPEAVRLSDIVCVSLGRGTRITLPDGRQKPIEALSPGDPVLTRDHGPQPVRWIGRATLRAQGAFAPVVIAAGTLGNAGDLVVSPHHRMFLYQRRRHPLLQTSELLVQAKHLTDGETIFRREGGFVDYYSLAFDRHEIIYAEGIPAESLLVNEATLAHLPDALAEDVRTRFPGLSQHQHFGTEAGRHLLETIGRNRLIGPNAVGGAGDDRA